MQQGLPRSVRYSLTWPAPATVPLGLFRRIAVSSQPQLSPDGRWWWDSGSWHPVSDDRHWWWDGVRWQSLAGGPSVVQGPTEYPHEREAGEPAASPAMPDPSLRWLKLRFPGTCLLCGIPIAKGEPALYDPKTKRIRCVKCPADVPP